MLHPINATSAMAASAMRIKIRELRVNILYSFLFELASSLLADNVSACNEVRGYRSEGNRMVLADTPFPLSRLEHEGPVQIVHGSNCNKETAGTDIRLKE